jgi:hypothetical protein
MTVYTMSKLYLLHVYMFNGDTYHTIERCVYEDEDEARASAAFHKRNPFNRADVVPIPFYKKNKKNSGTKNSSGRTKRRR